MTDRLEQPSERNQRDFDGLLDRALGSYTAHEPRAGLTKRVLSSIDGAETELARRQGWDWKTIWALPAALALLAAIGIPLSYRLGRQETAVRHIPEAHRFEVADVPRSAPLAPPLAQATRRVSAPHGSLGVEETEAKEITTSAGPIVTESKTAAAPHYKLLAEEPTTLSPIVVRPITIPPIDIQAVN
jgi:hypothetical protein